MPKLSKKGLWAKILGLKIGDLVRPAGYLAHESFWIWDRGLLVAVIPAKFFIGEVLEFVEAKECKIVKVIWISDRRIPDWENTYLWVENRVEPI